jgi:leucyl aminopeptidase (aminopeptidase T)
MTDPRYRKLAKLLVAYSTELKKGDRALLDMIDVPDEFTIELIRAARLAGATPLVEVRHTRVSRELLLEMTDRHAALVRDLELFRMKKVQAYIAIRGSERERKRRRARRPHGPLLAHHPAGARLSRQQNALVRAALADAEHGAGGGHEHRGV